LIALIEGVDNLLTSQKGVFHLVKRLLEMRRRLIANRTSRNARLIISEHAESDPD
jgi:hypothetical protein